MFLELASTKPDVSTASKAFVLACYKKTKSFPSEEKFGIISQIRRATLSVQLKIAEGFSRKSSVERKRFYEIARGSVIEIDTAPDIAVALEYTSKQRLEDLWKLMIRSFQMILK